MAFMMMLNIGVILSAVANAAIRINMLPVFLLLDVETVTSNFRRTMDRTMYFENIDVNMSWTIHTDTQSMFVELIAPISRSASWMAFGISDTGGMKDADIALISLYDHRIYDLYSEDFIIPKMDKIQNYELLYLETTEDGLRSVAQFKRRLIACDGEDFTIKTDRRRHQLMIAYNEYDPLISMTTNSELHIMHHQYQQRKEVNLFFDEDLFLPQTGDDELFEDFILENHTISQSDGNTQYWCSYFNLMHERYVTGKWMLDGSNYGIVHHVLLYHCDDSAVPDSEAMRCGPDHYSPEMNCQLITGTASSEPSSLPSKIYYPLEIGVYFLEVHFDLNLVYQLDLGDIDVSGSGLRTLYSSEQRELALAAAAMSLVDFAIPPNTDSYTISGALHSGCTEMFLPDEGIDILSIIPHAHYLAREIRLDKISRDGVLETLQDTKHYDFDRQFSVPVHYKLYPGDSLRIQCIYDSSNVDTWTYYGTGTNDEMCQIYLAYTDKVDNFNLIAVGTPGTDALLNSSYCGPNSISVPTWDMVDQFESLIFNNLMEIRSSNKGLKVEDDVDVLCQLLLDKETDFIPSHLVWRFDIPIFSMYPTVIIGIAMWFMLKLTEYALSRIQPGCYTEFADSVEHKRKVVVYLCSVLFYSVILAILSWEMCWNATDTLIGDQCEFVHNDSDEEHSVTIPYGIATAGSLSVIFLVIELMYRMKVDWDLYLHHILQTAIVFLVTHSIQSTMNLYLFRFGFWWLMQIGTEQPIFIALFIRKLKLKIISESNYPKMFYVAAINHYITKIGTTAIIWYYYARMLSVEDDDDCSPWYVYDVSFNSFLQKDDGHFDWKTFTEISIGIVSPILFLLQMWQGFGYYQLGRPRKNMTETEMAANMEKNDKVAPIHDGDTGMRQKTPERPDICVVRSTSSVTIPQ